MRILTTYVRVRVHTRLQMYYMYITSQSPSLSPNRHRLRDLTRVARSILSRTISSCSSSSSRSLTSSMVTFNLVIRISIRGHKSPNYANRSIQRAGGRGDRLRTIEYFCLRAAPTGQLIIIHYWLAIHS